MCSHLQDHNMPPPSVLTAAAAAAYELLPTDVPQQQQQQQQHSIQRIFESLTHQRPEIGTKVALICDRLHLTFADFEWRADRLADQLTRRLRRSANIVNGSGSGSKDADRDLIVAVCFHPSVELLVALLAVFKSGGAYLPVDPQFPAHRVAHILNDAKPQLLLTAPAVLQQSGFDVLVGDIPVINYSADQDQYRDQDQDDGQRQENGSPAVFERQQELAVVLYTSGSTGTPKGVRLTHRNIIHRLCWQWKTFPYRASEVGCFKTALTFVDSIAEIWAPLLRCVPLVVISKAVTRNPELLVATLETYGISRLVLVPSLLSSLLTYLLLADNGRMKKRPGRLNQLRLWVCSGEVLSDQLLLQFFDYFGDGFTICNFYGSTEVTGDVTFVTFNSRDQVTGSLVDGRVPLGIS